MEIKLARYIGWAILGTILGIIGLTLLRNVLIYHYSKQCVNSNLYDIFNSVIRGHYMETPDCKRLYNSTTLISSWLSDVYIYIYSVITITTGLIANQLINFLISYQINDKFKQNNSKQNGNNNNQNSDINIPTNFNNITPEIYGNIMLNHYRMYKNNPSTKKTNINPTKIN